MPRLPPVISAVLPLIEKISENPLVMAHYRVCSTGCVMKGGGQLSDDPGTELKQATDAIRSAQDVVELLVVLLKICRRHANEVVAAAQDRETRRWMVQEAARTEAAAAAFQSRVLTPADQDMVIYDLEHATDLAVTARAWALGIDTAMRTQAQVYSQLC